MYNPYNERICNQCPFKGKVFEIKAGTSRVKYINCQRDNKDAQDNFIKTNKNESLLLWVRQSEFLHCLYANNGAYSDI